MRLQILVSQYNETEEVVAPLLKSLAIQQGIDLSEIGVIIVNDGSEVKLSEEFLHSFPFPVEYIRAEHKGVSAARNRALDEATAEYVMFCDADDMFISACGLYILFREMRGQGFNALSSVFVEETRDPKTGERIYINHETDSTFVHGKVYRRSFLKHNNIRWDDSLTIHEDSYFNCLAQKVAREIKYCKEPFYLWKWRDDSVCRRDPKYILKTYVNMLESSTALVREFLARGMQREAEYYAANMIYDGYFTMNKDEWCNEANADYRKSTEDRFCIYYSEFRELFESVSPETRNGIIVGMKNRFFAEGVLLESVTFDEWIKHISALSADSNVHNFGCKSL